jgi:segregation and condensation protein B
MDSAEKSEDTLAMDSAEDRISTILDDESELALEALLFATPEPLSDKEIAKIIGHLNDKYTQWGRSFRIEKFGSRYRYYTIADFDKYIGRLAEIPRPVKLSRAALEVLSIVAYKQPAIKAEIERIRGINSDGVIRTLIDKNLVEAAGRSDGPGRPVLYRTTQEFLEFFGISDLSELPEPEISDIEPEMAGSLILPRPPENPQSDNSSDEVE